jgi:hypothetical protein
LKSGWNDFKVLKNATGTLSLCKETEFETTREMLVNHRCATCNTNTHSTLVQENLAVLHALYKKFQLLTHNFLLSIAWK